MQIPCFLHTSSKPADKTGFSFPANSAKTLHDTYCGGRTKQLEVRPASFCLAPLSFSFFNLLKNSNSQTEPLPIFLAFAVPICYRFILYRLLHSSAVVRAIVYTANQGNGLGSMKSDIRTTRLVTIAALGMVLGLHACKKQEPMQEETSPPERVTQESADRDTPSTKPAPPEDGQHKPQTTPAQETHQTDPAISDSSKAVDSGSAEAYSKRALLYYTTGQYDQAISEYTKAIELNPKNAMTYYYRGNAYRAKDQYKEAVSDYTKVLELNPTSAEAYHNRAMMYYKQGQPKPAISDFTKAIEINPRLMQAYCNRGAAYIAEGLYDQAISDCTKAIEMDSRYAEAYFNRGAAYIAKRLYDEGISDCSRAIEINPMHAQAYCNRAVAYYRKSRYDPAISDYTKAIEIEPSNAKALDGRATAYGAKGEYERAISDYTKVIEISPTFTTAYTNRGIAYYKKGEYDKAWEDVQKAESQGAQIPPAFLKALRQASGRER